MSKQNVIRVCAILSIVSGVGRLLFQPASKPPVSSTEFALQNDAAHAWKPTSMDTAMFASQWITDMPLGHLSDGFKMRGVAVSKIIQRAEDLITGGLYSIDNGDGTFGVVKLLVVDSKAAHLRVYKQKFTTRPTSIDESTLTLGSVKDGDGFGIGHMPLHMAGFIDWKPAYLKTAPVTEDELKGYRLWSSSDGGVW